MSFQNNALIGGVDSTGVAREIGVSDPAAASGTLTSDATAPDNGDIVVVGGVAYYARTTLTSPAVANEVLIGASAAAFLDNLKAAVNRTIPSSGTFSDNTAANPLVTATTNTDTTQLFVARSAGAAGNSIATTDTSAHLSWGSTTLTGGTNAGLTLGGTITVTPSSTARTTALSANTAASGTVTAGKQSVEFIFSADFIGSVKTVAIDLTSVTNPFGSMRFAANGSDTLDSIAWTRSAGTLYIQTIT